MKTSIMRSTRFYKVSGIAVAAALGLAACAGGPPDLAEITESAEQQWKEATSFSYSLEDPDGLTGEDLNFVQYAGQTDGQNFQLEFETESEDSTERIEILQVDASNAFVKMDRADEAVNELLGDAAGGNKWVVIPTNEIEDFVGSIGAFDGLHEQLYDQTFSLIHELSEEELDTVEVEESELDGQEVYQYTVPATADAESDIYTGTESVTFTFDKETSVFLQLEAVSGESSITYSFSDLNEVDVFEAPAEEDTAEVDWLFG